MPELPEVQTTVNGLQEHVVGLRITDVWSDYNSPHFKGSATIKDPLYFARIKKRIIDTTIISASRRAKNILIGLSNGCTLLVHLKMTGHLLYGQYRFNTTKKKDPWEAITPESLKDPYNKHVHFVLSFSNKKYLALSDVRKFAKVTLIEAGMSAESDHLHNIGPEPLENKFDFDAFVARINLRPSGKIKQVLMNQQIIAGIGNIYADESLWRTGVHPAQKVSDISAKDLRLLFVAIKQTLSRGIDFGGDSTSDYRNIHGNKGEFHESHHAYRRTGTPCDKKGCDGTIVRIVLGGRGTHFCDKHQRLR
ncbi:MAG: bifunctional DNA-formamidopyrimidine glycosylase/DNA-(apurinic or apyrimidinic site) lyase [Patescibacteria group bacterium]